MSMFSFTSTAGLRYHVMSAEERRQSNLHNLKPRRKKYDYRVAVLGGSEENTCQYFNCKGDYFRGLCINKIRELNPFSAVTSLYVRICCLWTADSEILRRSSH